MVEERIRVLKRKQLGASLLFLLGEYALFATVVVVYYQHKKETADDKKNNRNTDAATNANDPAFPNNYTIVIAVLVVLAVAIVAVVLYIRTKNKLEHTMAVLRKADEDIETRELVMKILAEDRKGTEEKLKIATDKMATQKEVENKLRAELAAILLNKADLETQLEERASTLQQQIEEIEGKNKKIVALFDKLMDEKEETQTTKRKVIKLSGQIMENKAEVRDLKMELEKTKLLNDQIQSAYEEKIFEIARNNNFEKERNEEVTFLRDTINRLKKIESSYNNDANEAGKKEEKAQEIRKLLESELNELRKKKEEEIEAMKNMLNEADKSLKDLKIAFDEKVTKIQELENELQKSNSTLENTKLRNMITVLTKDKQLMEENNEKLNLQYTELLKQQDKLQGKTQQVREIATETDSDNFSFYKTRYLQTAELLKEEQEARKQLINEHDEFQLNLMEAIIQEREALLKERNITNEYENNLRELAEAGSKQSEEKNQEQKRIKEVLKKTIEKLDTLEDQIQKRKEDAAKFEKQNMMLNLDLDKKESERLAIENRLESEALKFVEEKAKDAKQIEELRLLYEKKEKELQNKSSDFDRATRRVDSLKQKISGLETEYSKRERFWLKMKKKFQMDIDALTQKTNEQIQTFLSERDALMQTFQEAQRLASQNEETLKNEVVNLKNKLTDIGLRKDETKKRLRLMRVKQAKEVRKVRVLSRKVELYKKRIEKKEIKIKNLRNQKGDSKAAQLKLQKIIEKLKVQEKNAQEKEKNASKQLQERENKVQELTQELSQQTQETSKKINVLKKLQDELIDLKNQNTKKIGAEVSRAAEDLSEILRLNIEPMKGVVLQVEENVIQRRSLKRRNESGNQTIDKKANSSTFP